MIRKKKKKEEKRNTNISKEKWTARAFHSSPI
jgi:hypothetical protein